MKVTMKLEGVEGLNTALQRFADAVGKDVAAILPDEARLFAMSGMTAQPPTAGKVAKGTGEKTWANGNTRAAQKGGEEAVARSGRNASPVMVSNWFEDPNLKATIAAGDLRATQGLLDEKGIPIKVGAFDESYWRRMRDGRGRVHKMRRGNVLIRQQDVIARQAIVKKKQARVGMMKSAWGHLVQKFNSYTSAKSKVPPWVSRHGGKGAAWLGAQTFISLGGAKKSIRIQGPDHPATGDFTKIAIKSRIKSIQKKTREVLRGRAAIINGKFTILKR